MVDKDERSIYERMAAAMARIGAISKSGTAGTGSFSYNFRGIDQVTNAFYPILRDEGIFLTPEVREVTTDWTETGRNNTKTRVIGITMAVHFHGLMGDSVTAVSHAEAFDMGDKAGNKVLSTALRYALLQTFCVPTEGEAEHESENFVGSDYVSDYEEPARDPELMTQPQWDKLVELGAQAKELYGHEWDPKGGGGQKDKFMKGRKKLDWEKTTVEEADELIAAFTTLLEEEPF